MECYHWSINGFFFWLVFSRFFCISDWSIQGDGRFSLVKNKWLCLWLLFDGDLHPHPPPSCLSSSNSLWSIQFSFDKSDFYFIGCLFSDCQKQILTHNCQLLSGFDMKALVVPSAFNSQSFHCHLLPSLAIACHLHFQVQPFRAISHLPSCSICNRRRVFQLLPSINFMCLKQYGWTRVAIELLVNHSLQSFHCPK